MLMTAMPMDSTCAPSSASPPPPWLPADILYDFTASSTPSPSPAPAPDQPTLRHHHLLRAASGGARRVAKRRPRPSRKLPTTYISADPASFRRMVHQVTGADDLPLAPLVAQEILHRPAPSRAGATLLLPTLDTSAFLFRGPAQTASPCDGLAASPALDVAEAGAVGGGAYNDSPISCVGFPTMESWDALF